MLQRHRRLLTVLFFLAVLALAWGPFSWINQGRTQAPGVTVKFQTPDFTVLESTSTTVYATIVVTISDAPNVDVTVAYATAIGGTASVNFDYTAVSGPLTFKAGKTDPQSFLVPILPDQISEGDETVLLQLSNPQFATLGDPSTATLTIQDAQPATIAFSPGTINLVPQTSADLAATITPYNAQNITFVWAYPDIAELGGAAPKFTVKGLTPGNTQLLGLQAGVIRAVADVMVAQVPGPPVALRINPVSSPANITDPAGALNQIKNPAGIVIVAEETDRTAANAAIVEVDPKSIPDGGDKKMIEWKWVSVDGKGKVEFFKHPDAGTTGEGMEVYLHGTAEGAIKLEARAKGVVNAPVLDWFEAQVVPLKTVPIRVNILSSKTVTLDVTPADAIAHIKAANIYLRQVGVFLKPGDADVKPTSPEATVAIDTVTKKEIPGYFTAIVAEKLAMMVPNTQFDRENSIGVNPLKKVVQITYIGFLGKTIGNNFVPDETFGIVVNRPENNLSTKNAAGDKVVKLTYRMTVKDLKPIERIMLLRPANINMVDPDIWGVLITRKCGPDPSKDILMYANTIAHEVSHVLNLGHRGDITLIDTDDLIDPWEKNGGNNSIYNLMYAYSATANNYWQTTSDLDLIQLIGIRNSPVLKD